MSSSCRTSVTDGWSAPSPPGCWGAASSPVAFNFPQVTLGTHLIESLAPMAGFSFPAKWNWLFFGAVTAWLSLSYGRKGGRGTRLVEGAMKSAIAVMFLAFGAVLLVVGVEWRAAAKGFFVPWLPGGGVGLDMFIATTAAAVVVMDWVLFNYAGLVRGWGPKHERLARIDIVGGLFVPFVVVNFLVISVFASEPSFPGRRSRERAGAGGGAGAASRGDMVPDRLLHRIPGGARHPPP